MKESRIIAIIALYGSLILANINMTNFGFWAWQILAIFWLIWYIFLLTRKKQFFYLCAVMRSYFFKRLAVKNLSKLNWLKTRIQLHKNYYVLTYLCKESAN